MKNNGLLIRTDASPEIGSGHAMRCLALAQAAKDYDIRTTFVMNECSETIKTRIRSEGFELQKHVPEGKHIVIDGYQFDAKFQQTVKSQGRRVLFIDDFGHCDRYVSDLVLNQNIYADESFYTKKYDDTQLLLGPKYVLLRREFTNSQGSVLRSFVGLRTGSAQDDTLAAVPKILITLGGFDHSHLMEKIERALKNINADIRVARNTLHMPELMQWADVAISAAGTTVYELAYMGIPAAMITVADNQKRVAKGMEEAGYGLDLGWFESVSEDHICKALEQLLKTHKQPPSRIDGFGVHRVLSRLFQWPLWLRPVTKKDSKLLFDWANDPFTRINSFSPDPILWNNHNQWLEKKLENPDCLMFIALNTNDEPIGQIRFDKRDSTMEIDVSIAESARGKGYGTSLIQMGTHRLFATTNISEIHAHVKKENTPSFHTFENAGYENIGEQIVNSVPSFHFYMRR